jgi:hypothetical protein
MRRALLALFMIVALVAAGCGGDDGGGGGATSKAEYSKQLKQFGTALQKSLASITDATGTGTKPEQIAARLDSGTKALRDATQKLDDIEPPADVKAAHAKLVEGLTEVSDVFKAAADSARKGDTAALTAALKRLADSDGIKKINEAQAEFKAKGINVEGGGS